MKLDVLLEGRRFEGIRIMDGGGVSTHLRNANVDWERSYLRIPRISE